MHNALLGSGFPCPQCGAPITVTIEQLTTADAIRCSECGLELRVDQEQSRETLNAVRDLCEQLARARGSES
jgi:transcription elongation factor Elf1